MARMVQGPQFRDYQGLQGILQVLNALQSMQPDEGAGTLDRVLQKVDAQQNPFGRRMQPRDLPQQKPARMLQGPQFQQSGGGLGNILSLLGLFFGGGG